MHTYLKFILCIAVKAHKFILLLLHGLHTLYLPHLTCNNLKFVVGMLGLVNFFIFCFLLYSLFRICPGLCFHNLLTYVFSGLVSINRGKKIELTIWEIIQPKFSRSIFWNWIQTLASFPIQNISSSWKIRDDVGNNYALYTGPFYLISRIYNK